MKRPLRLAVGVALLIFLTWAAAGKPLRHFELKAESSKCWELVPKDSKLELVASGMGFTEGPVRGFVYVSDEVLNKIFRIYPVGARKSSFHWATRTAIRTTSTASLSTAQACSAR